MERIAEYFVNYLFNHYQGVRHVRRVATWIGLILKGIERSGADNIRINRSRQLIFDYRDRPFKVRYNHQVGGRGGIEIVEILPGRGAPDGEIVFQAKNLQDSDDVYQKLNDILNNFIDH